MIDSMGQSELKKLIEDATKEYRQRARARFTAIAREAGFDIRQLFGKGKLRGPARVKYRDAAGNTWTGRGKRPIWLRDAINGGAALESFAVQGD